MSGYEDEYRGCIESGSFDVALYNECGYLHGDPLVVIPPAPTKRAFCLLRGLPTSDRRYKQLTKALKHFGYATLWNVDSLWSVNYYDDGPYSMRDYMPHSVKPYKLGHDAEHYSPATSVFNNLGSFIVRDAATVWTEDGKPKVFTPPFNASEIDDIVETFKEMLGVHHASWWDFDSVLFQKHESTSAEWRAFFFDGRILDIVPTNTTNINSVPPPPDNLINLALEESKPYTAFDFALTSNGNWRMTRFFDAQFTDLPRLVNTKIYYEKLAKLVQNAPVVPTWSWCLVGEIVDENIVGKEHRLVHGTRHFVPGTKVYCVCELGGNGWERICVIGVPRYSDNLVSMIIPATKICNFRLEKVYDKRIIEVMTNGWLGGAFCSINPAQIGFGWTNSDEDREEIERLAEYFQNTALDNK